MEAQERNRLITFIKENDKFYEFANFAGHTIEQLLKIKARIQLKEFATPNKKLKTNK